MNFNVNGATAYCYTGGKAFNPTQPTVVFIHGVINDHSVWALQSRYFANHCWNVLAVDLPGHCRSGGEAPASVEAAAAFIAALLDAAGVQRAALVGHSWGSLIALETAAQLKDRISHLALVGTAYPMKVSQPLLDAALNEPEKALHMVNVFSRSSLAPPAAPGSWIFSSNLALGRRVIASNAKVNLFHLGFSACNNYAKGEQAMEQVTCPVLFLLGAVDQMTTPKAAQTLIAKAKASGKIHTVQMLPVGHHQMTETPEATLSALKVFLNS